MKRPEELLFDLLALVMRPVVRFCIRRSLKFREFFDICRAAFVSEARRELEREGTEVNVSRLSALTGLSRREVDAYLKDAPASREPNLIRKVLGKWQSSSEYSSSGKARALTCVGSGSEFFELVASVSQDINPYTVLFELERAELVQRRGDRLALQSPVYLAAGDARKGFEMLGADIDDLFRTVEENLFDKPEPLNLHIKTHYDNIVLDALPAIRAWFLKRGEDLHREAREFLSKYDKDLNPSLKDQQGGGRVGIGTFSFASEVSSSESSPETWSEGGALPKPASKKLAPAKSKRRKS